LTKTVRQNPKGKACIKMQAFPLSKLCVQIKHTLKNVIIKQQVPQEQLLQLQQQVLQQLEFQQQMLQQQ